MKGKQTVHVRIEGRVQGVFFRAWTEQRARQLGLSGWVRNRRDGSVEALFAGPPEAVDRMLAECHAGPPDARVDHVHIVPDGEAAPEGFKVRPTE